MYDSIVIILNHCSAERLTYVNTSRPTRSVTIMASIIQKRNCCLCGEKAGKICLSILDVNLISSILSMFIIRLLRVLQKSSIELNGPFQCFFIMIAAKNE